MHRILDKSADDENGIATFKVIRCDPEVLQMTHTVWVIPVVKQAFMLTLGNVSIAEKM